MKTPAPPKKAPDDLVFLVKEAPEGGYTAEALGQSIFTEADDIKTLHGNIRDAVKCHFDEGRHPKVVQLHFVKDEQLAI